MMNELEYIFIYLDTVFCVVPLLVSFLLDYLLLLLTL